MNVPRTLVATGLLAAVLAVAGCDMLPGGAGPMARDADESFELLLQVGSTRYTANQPIDLSATLAYLGPEAGIDLAGSGSGLISFSAKQLDGRLQIGGAQTSDCKAYRLNRGQPLEVPYMKSGAWSNDDPDAAFYQAFFKDPVFRLPPGRWQIFATAEFYEKECPGESHGLGADLTIVVD
jgi:hypothetical protein